MTENNRWLLPDGIDELLSQDATRLEKWRRQLLDIFYSWGYELIIPPLIEHLDSLLIGMGNDLGHDTFKLIDQHSGKLLGVRADMTPQVARIEANRLQHDRPVRLCYMGSVLRSRMDATMATRSPLQMGAELYGHSGIESDFEIISLMLECLSAIGLADPFVDIGHVGIFRSLARFAHLSSKHEQCLFDALQRKAVPEIEAIVAECSLQAKSAQAFLHLAELNGERKVLDDARALLSHLDPGVDCALRELTQISTLIEFNMPHCKLHYDLAELRGYSYHTGLVFAAYVPGHGQEIAKGGRYDNIGEKFGRGRPATGFSCDLRTLSMLVEHNKVDCLSIFAPFSEDIKWMQEVRRLRAQGQSVICELPGQVADARRMGCGRVLKYIKQEWVVESVGSPCTDCATPNDTMQSQKD